MSHGPALREVERVGERRDDLGDANGWPGRGVFSPQQGRGIGSEQVHTFGYISAILKPNRMFFVFMSFCDGQEERQAAKRQKSQSRGTQCLFREAGISCVRRPAESRGATGNDRSTKSIYLKCQMHGEDRQCPGMGRADDTSRAERTFETNCRQIGRQDLAGGVPQSCFTAIHNDKRRPAAFVASYLHFS